MQGANFLLSFISFVPGTSCHAIAQFHEPKTCYLRCTSSRHANNCLGGQESQFNLSSSNFFSSFFSFLCFFLFLKKYPYLLRHLGQNSMTNCSLKSTQEQYNSSSHKNSYLYAPTIKMIGNAKDNENLLQ